MTDTRIAYGAQCSWWGTIHEVGNVDGLPCCPICKGMLFEINDEKEWWDGVKRYQEHRQDPDYEDFIKWLKGRCFANSDSARFQYEREKRYG